MQSQEPFSQGRRRGTIAGSLCIAAVVLFWDVGNEGFYGLSLLVCPLWFLISAVKNSVQRPGWGIAALRVSMPLLTFAIAFGNGNLQWKISDANAQRVIKACEEFRVDNGRALPGVTRPVVAVTARYEKPPAAHVPSLWPEAAKPARLAAAVHHRNNPAFSAWSNRRRCSTIHRCFITSSASFLIRVRGVRGRPSRPWVWSTWLPRCAPMPSGSS
jgi:hypothetical protein